MAKHRAMDAAMATALLGMRQPGGAAAAFALSLVMYTLAPWSMPEGAALEAALVTARTYRLGEDLAGFLPPEPGRFARRDRKDSYRALVIALKRVDELPPGEREDALDEVRALLGSR